jgi:hypothetical protein
MQYKYNGELWDELVREGFIHQSNENINILNNDDVVTILATMEFFGATNIFMQQTQHDLTLPKFRVFDWLAMNVMGRNDDNREVNNTALKVLVYAFRQAGYDEKQFIDNLRVNDYQCETGWEKIEIDQNENNNKDN